MEEKNTTKTQRLNFDWVFLRVVVRLSGEACNDVGDDGDAWHTGPQELYNLLELEPRAIRPTIHLGKRPGR